MFTVRPHPPKGPSSAPFSSPGGAVVAFGGRFPALLLLLGLVFVFLPVYFCVRFSWVFALPAYRPWSFIFCLRLGRPSLVGGSAASSFSGSVLGFSVAPFFFGPVFLPGLPFLDPGSLCFRLGPSPFGCSLLLGRSSSLYLLSLLGTSFILVSSSVLFSASWDIFFCLAFLISCRSIFLYFFIYFYLFRFVRLKDCGRGG